MDGKKKIRACERGWEYAQITDNDGSVEICCWASMHFPRIGKLTEESMYDIWHGEKAEKFRQSFIDGSYRYCEKEKCPWMANGTLEEHMREYDGVLDYPTALSISNDKRCNYACRCCADNGSGIKWPAPPADKQAKIDAELDKFIDNVRVISANGRGELFASTHILETLSKWKPKRPAEDIYVVLETNGSMFDEKHWGQIANLGQYKLKVSITVMSFEQAAYSYLSGSKLPVQRIVDNLHFVSKLRQQGIINDFEIGTVIHERNFREMPEFTRRCIEEFQVDRVRLRPYFPFGNVLDPGTKWLFDVRNPQHPYYEEYVEVMKDPIFQHPKAMMWSGEEVSHVGANPYQKDKDNFDVIRYFAVDEQIGGKLAGYFSERGITALAVYGMSYTGHAFVQTMQKTYVRIDRIIDKGKVGEKEHGMTFVGPGDLPKDYALPIVVTAPFFFEEIKAELEQRLDHPQILNIRDIIEDIEGCCR